MDDQNKKIRNRNNLIWGAIVIVIIFVFIFSMFHLQQRGEYRLDDAIVAYNAPNPYDNAEIFNTIESGNDSERQEAISTLKLNFENATLNNEPYQAQQNGLLLALAYLKAHDRESAKNLLAQLISSYPYDTEFVDRCKDILERIK